MYVFGGSWNKSKKYTHKQTNLRGSIHGFDRPTSNIFKSAEEFLTQKYEYIG